MNDKIEEKKIRVPMIGKSAHTKRSCRNARGGDADWTHQRGLLLHVDSGVPCVCVCVVGDCSFWVVFDTSNNECFMVSGLIIKMQFDMMTMTYKIKIVDDPLEMR